jgi:hypothetical protein
LKSTYDFLSGKLQEARIAKEEQLQYNGGRVTRGASGSLQPSKILTSPSPACSVCSPASLQRFSRIIWNQKGEVKVEGKVWKP